MSPAFEQTKMFHLSEESSDLSFIADTLVVKGKNQLLQPVFFVFVCFHLNASQPQKY